MCIPRGAAATAKGLGTIGDGHSEIDDGQVGRFGVFFAFFATLQRIQLLVKRSIGETQHLKSEDCFGRSPFFSPLLFVVPLQSYTMPGKEQKTRRTPKITPYQGKEEHKIIPFEGKGRQKEEKKEKERKVQRIIPYQGRARKEEEKEGTPFPFEGKGKKEEEKEEKQQKKVQRIIFFEGKAKEKKETLATLFGDWMLGSMLSNEVGIAPAAPP